MGKIDKKICNSLYGFNVRLKQLEKQIKRINSYPLRAVAVFIGLFTMFCAVTLSVTSYWSFGILWCSLIITGFSLGLVCWGICGGFEWTRE
jgi:hypothetical protein